MSALVRMFRSGAPWSLMDMITFCSGEFYRIVCDLRDLRHQIVTGNEVSNNELIDEYTRHDLLCSIVKSQLEQLKEQLEIIECRVTIAAINENLPMLSGSAVHTRDGLVWALDDIDAQLKREASSIYLIALNYSEKQLFHPTNNPWGDDVAEKFKVIEYEVIESSKCLAVGRSTASAFHSIRSLEAGIRALSRCLGIADPTKGTERSWAKLLGNIKGEIDKRWPSNLIRTGDAKIFEQAYASLAAMNPYRNDTMHLDQKYTEEEAKDIYAIVGAFMRKLSSRMNEDGLHTA